MTDTTLGVIFRVTLYPCLPGTIHLSFCRISQQSIHFSICLTLFIFKESIININIKLIINELGGPPHSTWNFYHDLMQHILTFFLL